jgi:hypothetical protein
MGAAHHSHRLARAKGPDGGQRSTYKGLEDPEDEDQDEDKKRVFCLSQQARERFPGGTPVRAVNVIDAA